MSKFVLSGSNVKIAKDDDIFVENSLPAGAYLVKQEKMGELILNKFDGYQKPQKVYGELNDYSDRIIKTFMDKKRGMGVLLTGVKGSGKTFLAKLVSLEMLEMGYPTVIVSERVNTDELSVFLASLGGRCVVIFDEFEKVFEHSQEGLLSLLDGMFENNNLFIFTANDANRISPLFINRPSRIFYHFKFKGLSDDAIRDFCLANLKDLKHVSDILNLKYYVGDLSFDILASVVEEINRYDDTVKGCLSVMNVCFSNKPFVYNVLSFKNDKDEDVPFSQKVLNVDIFDGFYFRTQEHEDTYFDEDDFKRRDKDVFEFDNGEYKLILKLTDSKRFDPLTILGGVA